MARPRRHHVQQEMNLPRRDKHGGLRGGARPGAGRPKLPRNGRRISEPHRVRETLRASTPVHVIMRATQEVGTLRKHEVFRAVREATLATGVRHEATFHIVHLSVQRTHIHLIVEAANRTALWKGMQAFGISAARHINALVSERRGKRRSGTVFTDRYHAIQLTTPKQVRNTVAYVLNNWRHHGEHKQPMQRPWKVDPYSSALAFDGWKERDDRGTLFRVPDGYDGFFVWLPKTWLLKTGWRRRGLVSMFEIPGVRAGAE